MSSLSRVLAGFVLAGTVMIQCVLPVQAGEVQNRIDNQQARIHQGVQSGELTRGEHRRDERALRSITRQRNRDLRRNGGYLTQSESRHLNARLNHNSARVYRTKHNGAVR